MKRVFADTYYWIALLNDKDQGHAAAELLGQSLRNDMLITTQEVLSEVLTHFSGYGRFMRQSVTAFVRNISSDPTIEVRAQSDQSFLGGLALYEARPDKDYSLTDCIVMEAMRNEGVTEILTQDTHFTQEGFTILL
jgi:predicted nucleic acid-binding protein